MVGIAILRPLANGAAVLVTSRELDRNPSDANGIVVRGKQGIGARIVRLDLSTACLGSFVASVPIVDLDVQVVANLVEATDVRLFATCIRELAAATWRLGAVEADAEVDLVDCRVVRREEVLNEGKNGKDTRDDSDNVGHGDFRCFRY